MAMNSQVNIQIHESTPIENKSKYSPDIADIDDLFSVYNNKFDDFESGEKLDHAEYKDAVKAFFDQVFHSKTLIDNYSIGLHYWRALMKKHDFIAPFYGYSLRMRRTLRWIRLFFLIFLALFFDTLIFQTFFPDDGTCESYTSETVCLAAFNSATSTNKCDWTEDSTITAGGSCSLRDPPSSLVFTIILAFITVLLMLPVKVLFDFVLDEYACKRPNIASIGLLTNEYFGSATWEKSECHILFFLFKN